MKDRDFFISIIVGLVFIGLGVVCIYTLSGADGAMLATGGFASGFYGDNLKVWYLNQEQQLIISDLLPDSSDNLYPAPYYLTDINNKLNLITFLRITEVLFCLT